MSDGGFAIRCPNCREWTRYEMSPEDVVVSSIDEFNSIMSRFQQAIEKREVFKHQKLLRCKSPRLFCPAPFEATIFKSGDKDFEDLKVSESWSSVRHFRLYKDDEQSRWDNENEQKYCAILFNTQPVQRLRHIELESLMNRELVSRLIAGMCVEIDTPLTFFAANVFEQEGGDEKPQTYWMPIEGYSQEQKLVPPRYSLFCKTCRDISVTKLRKEFEDKKYNVQNCPHSFGKDEKCMGREAACMQRPKDWDHCPAFVEDRGDKCPCYNSDLMLIERVEEHWRGKNVPKEGVRHRCHAGFREVGFPIEVHGHLVGVAITGQLFFDPDEIKRAPDFIKSKKVDGITVPWVTQKGEEGPLEKARQILIGLELKNRDEGKKTVFLTDESQVRQKIECLRPNLKRFENSAESHYRDFRARSEFAFRQELFGFVENNISQTDFFEKKIQHVLRRMQEFWAFEGTYLLNFSFDTAEVSTIAVSVLGEAQAFGFPGKRGCRLEIKWQQFHPYPYLHFRGSEPHSVSSAFNQAIPKIEEIIDRNNKNHNSMIKDGDCEFAVIIPTFRGVYIFVFAVRDQREVSSLESRSPGTISVLCQDMIFETCCEIVGEFHNVREFVERDRQVQIECLETLKREIDTEIKDVSTLLDVQLEVMLQDKNLMGIKDDLSKVGEGLAKIVAVPERRIREELTKLRSRDQA